MPVVPPDGVSALNATVHLLHRAVASTLHIRTEVPEGHPAARLLGAERMGTGALIAEGGLVLTAHYVVLGAASVEVVFPDGLATRAEVVGIDHAVGIALLRLARGDAPALQIRSLDEVKPGEEAFLVASVGDGRRASTGMIMAIEPFEAFWEYRLERTLLFTAEAPGLGGGPLLDRRGRMIGVSSLSILQVGRFTVAIPASAAQPAIEAVIREGSFRPARRRAWFGITSYDLRHHVVVAGVLPDSPAERDGVQPGDVLVALEGERIETRAGFYERIWQHEGGATLRLEVMREDQMQNLRVTTSSMEEYFA